MIRGIGSGRDRLRAEGSLRTDATDAMTLWTAAGRDATHPSAILGESRAGAERTNASRAKEVIDATMIGELPGKGTTVEVPGKWRTAGVPGKCLERGITELLPELTRGCPVGKRRNARSNRYCKKYGGKNC